MHRTELTVDELYEGQMEPNRSEWSSLENNKLPIALQNSFIIDEVSLFLVLKRFFEMNRIFSK